MGEKRKFSLYQWKKKSSLEIGGGEKIYIYFLGAIIQPCKPLNTIKVAPAPGSPPGRPDSSSGSSTVSAPSSAALSGDEQSTLTTVQTAPTNMEPSPRKKPRKQQLPPASAVNVSPEWVAMKREVGVRERLEWEGGRVLNSGEPGWEGRVSNWNSGTGRGWTEGGRGWEEGGGRGWEGRGWEEGGGRGWGGEVDQADDEDEMTTDEEKDKGSNFLKGKPQMSLKAGSIHQSIIHLYIY